MSRSYFKYFFPSWVHHFFKGRPPQQDLQEPALVPFFGSSIPRTFCSPFLSEGKNDIPQVKPRRPSPPRDPRDLGQLGTRLPLELIQEILNESCHTSQSTYLDVLLLSRAFYAFARIQCFPRIVRLQTTKQSHSFARCLENNPVFRPLVLHLWLNGPTNPSDMTPSQHQVLRNATALRSLACPSHILIYLAAWLELVRDRTLAHPHLTELTLLDNLHLQEPNKYKLFSKQITHLSVLEPRQPSAVRTFPWAMFPALQAYSCEVYIMDLHRHYSTLPLDLTPGQISSELGYLDGCPHDVRVAVTLGHPSLKEVKQVTLTSLHSCVVRVGTLAYYQWWIDRAVGGEGVWGN